MVVTRFLQTAHLLGGQIGTIVPTKIQKEKTMRVKHNEGYDSGITITHNGQKFITDNHDDTIKLLEKIEIACWGSSSYTD